MKKTKPTGVQGNWLRILPEKEESFIPQIGALIEVAKIVEAGPKSLYKNNIGDLVVVRDWMIERATVKDEVQFFTTDENVLKIL